MFMIIITIIIASFNIFWSAALHQHLAGHSIRRIEFSTTFKTFQNFQDMLRSFDDDDDFMTTMMMMMMMKRWKGFFTMVGNWVFNNSKLLKTFKNHSPKYKEICCLLSPKSEYLQITKIVWKSRSIVFSTPPRDFRSLIFCVLHKDILHARCKIRSAGARSLSLRRRFTKAWWGD